MELRVKKMAKMKGKSLKDIAEEMQITYVGLHSRLKAAKLNTLMEIATSLDCNVMELLEPGDQYFHAYDDENNWLGVLKRTH